MNEREKVIQALENCTAEIKCRDCPWDECEGQHEHVELPKGLALKAMRLLKDPDRVKVVRCGDCRYWEPPTKEEVEDGCTYGRCRSTGAGADVNDFCSSGERE